MFHLESVKTKHFHFINFLCLFVYQNHFLCLFGKINTHSRHSSVSLNLHFSLQKVWVKMFHPARFVSKDPSKTYNDNTFIPLSTDFSKTDAVAAK